MSISEEKMSEKVPAAGSGAGTGKDIGPGNGSPVPTITNQRGISEPAMIPAHGNGRLRLGREGDSNPNAGRIPKMTRESLTEAAGQAHEPYVKLRNDWLAKAQAFLDAGDIDKADRAQKAADRIQEGYMRYGIGSKQEVTLGNPEVVRKALQVYRDMGHGADDCVRFNDLLVAALLE